MRSTNWLATGLILAWLTVVHATAYAHTFNFDFTNGVSSTSDGFLLSSSGGTHWNRIGSDFFSSGTFDFGGQGTLNEFGEIAYPVGPGYDPWNDLRQIQPRRDLLHSANVAATGFDSSSLGWLELTRQPPPNSDELVKFFEMIYARPDRRYDIVVYHDVFQIVALTDIFGNVFDSGVSQLITVNGIQFPATLFSGVSPTEMHIGPPNYPPMGWGVAAKNLNPIDPLPGYLRIRGIQIRELVPEPGSLQLIVLAISACAIRRHAKKFGAG